MTNPLVLRIEGIAAYAAVLVALGLLLHWGIGPADAEKSAVFLVLGLLVPSVAVKQQSTPIPPPSGDVSLLAKAEVKADPEVK
jgi:hypothetical protein